MKKLLSFLIILAFAVACAPKDDPNKDDPSKETSTSKYKWVAEDGRYYDIAEISFNSDNKPVRYDVKRYHSNDEFSYGVLETISYNKDGVAESIYSERYYFEDGERKIEKSETLTGDKLDIELRIINVIIKTWTKI